MKCPKCGKTAWQNWMECLKCNEEGIKGMEQNLEYIKKKLVIMKSVKEDLE